MADDDDKKKKKDEVPAGKIKVTETKTTYKDAHESHKSAGWLDWKVAAVIAGAILIALPMLHGWSVTSTPPGAFPTTCRGSLPAVPLTTTPQPLPEGCRIDFAVLKGTVRFVQRDARVVRVTAGQTGVHLDHAISVAADSNEATIAIRFF